MIIDKYKYYLISGAVFLIMLLGAILAVGYVQYNALDQDFKDQTALLAEKNDTIRAISENQEFQKKLTQALDQLTDAQRKHFGEVDKAINQLRANDAKVQALLDTRIPPNLGELLGTYYREDRPKLSAPPVSLPKPSYTGHDK